jgi:hypothetical protein
MLAAYLFELLLEDDNATKGDTPPWKRVTLLILPVLSDKLDGFAVDSYFWYCQRKLLETGRVTW